MEVTDMYKQEQCISNLEQEISWIEDIKAHQFPYWSHTVNAMRQAIALLTAQKPVEPIMVNGEPECAACRYELRTDADSYCPCCGRKVKWE